MTMGAQATEHDDIAGYAACAGEILGADRQ